MDNIYFKLLKEYSDGLISLQDKGLDKTFRGGIYCRSCKMIHGRCPDAVYGFLVLYKHTKDNKYLEAAKDVFDYGYNMECLDGSMYNDAQAEWRCTTVFHTVAVIEALEAAKDILDSKTIEKFEERTKRMAEWLYLNLDENNPAHINYQATTSYALELAGRYFNINKYKERAKRMVDYAMKHFSENNILYGESTPHNALSDKGCNSIDIGYDVEETIPSLIKYAYLVNDEALKNRLEEILLSNLDFMFPDGAWDNTFGNRNYKWTYWGSRTSDGCAPGLLLMADRNPMFSEAAYRNVLLHEKCSKDGFLYGGRDYFLHNEHPCTHHAFEFINVLAFAIEKIDPKYLNPEHVSLPVEKEDYFKYYKELRTYKFKRGNYLATITDYDFRLMYNCHPSGGSISALYNKNLGPMIMGSTTIYVLTEPTNMQQTLDRDHHRSLIPRIELENNNTTYYSSFYTKAELSEKHDERSVEIKSKSGLSDRWLSIYQGLNPEFTYTLDENGLTIKIKNMTDGKFILPLISGKIKLIKGKQIMKDEIFYLIGGFKAIEYTYLPENNEIELLISE